LINPLFTCGKIGQYANQLSKRKEDNSNGQERHTYVTWDTKCVYNNSNEKQTYQVNALTAYSNLKQTKVLLNNQEDASIVHPKLPWEVQLGEREVRINGIAGLQLVHPTSYLQDFFPVNASEDTQLSGRPVPYYILCT
jgi:hypothetical protein